MSFARALPLLAAALVSAAPSAAQTIATGAGREAELAEAGRIDAYLADVSGAPAPRSQAQITTAEGAASASALPRVASLPPMAPDSPWARGMVGPTTGPLPLADAAADGRPPCDHKVHGEAGAEIGTRGERGGYGVASMPLDHDCQAQLTVGVSTQRGRWRGGDGELSEGSVRVDAPGFSLGVSGGSGRGGPVF